ncbi:diacylglycerol O-acyltransferase [Cryobacterium sp. CAN_C3]|nr:diacylglycerol O-acyltransferase [Cryobacterium sp. CAN_C3]
MDGLGNSPEDRAYPIQRTTPNDLMALATEYAGSPMQVAAILILDRPVDLAAVRSVLAERITAVARFRQRLQRTPFGCGRPVWIDHADFSIDCHVVDHKCPAPGDEAALLKIAATAAVYPLPRDRPLWSITVVHGLSGERSALIFVIHHVLADGIGGLAALGLLVDGAPVLPSVSFPSPQPSARELLAEATLSRVHALRQWPAALRLMQGASAELRGGRIDHPTPCSLNQPTGPHRQLTVARAGLSALSLSAHTNHATINDILLTAVSGALAEALHHRGESAETFVFSVPVSGRLDKAAPALGNHVGAMLVEVSPLEDTRQRLAAVAEVTQARGHSLGRGASAVLLEPVFRLLAQVKAFRWFVDHQRVVTSFLTNLRGPSTPMTFLGAAVTDIIPVTQINGNVTISFAALSYSGTLAVTLIADPVHCPDLQLICGKLQSQLDLLSAADPTRRTR